MLEAIGRAMAFLRQKQLLHRLGVVISIAVIGIACYVLYHMLRGIDTNEVLEACLKATNELWGEISAKNADFKKSIDAMQAYRSDQYLWWQVAEYTFDSFMIRSRTRG